MLNSNNPIWWMYFNIFPLFACRKKLLRNYNNIDKPTTSGHIHQGNQSYRFVFNLASNIQFQIGFIDDNFQFWFIFNISLFEIDFSLLFSSWTFFSGIGMLWNGFSWFGFIWILDYALITIDDSDEFAESVDGPREPRSKTCKFNCTPFQILSHKTAWKFIEDDEIRKSLNHPITELIVHRLTHTWHFETGV